MKFCSDPAVFAAAPAAPVALVPEAWTPVRLDSAVLREGEPQLDPAALAALQQEQAVAAAYADGLAAGAAEARVELEDAVRSALAATAEAAAQLRAAEAGRLASLQADLSALAVAVAHHLLGREVKDGQLMADLVRRALAELPREQGVRVRINPHDLSTLTAVRGPDGTTPPISAGRELTWVPDPELERGGVVVEGRDRIVDGRVDLALERIYRRLADG